ncbi:hemerythrin domain-containing protein [Ramlibacter rhizophilus]|uniref:Hemerythrin domain-containing protein n=1 Tax=Ramlibacter rhizophilus TaxID=1781167 RepID=A0A4Z0BHH5_9BURK|nr:hemerythrin domain-containing protein [Ramlibacter rhizophilus]TFY97923.1 hemerythrin domain-containing protein [Ramlibacter rhizophilus]
MNALIERVAPYATHMIRTDHAHVLAAFHQYQTDSAPRVKKGLVNTVCLALEVHAQLEEEIFYPAMRAVSDSDFLRKAVPEHNEMRRLITQLRNMEPTDAGYDGTFMELMRDVMHHVADEETTVLPEAERLMRDRLGELGAKMTRRRLELMAPRSGAMATNMARSLPATSIALAAGLVAGGVLLGNRLLSSRPHRFGSGTRTGASGRWL